MKKHIFSVVFLVMFCLAPQVNADIICLTNGNIIKGMVVRETEKVVEVEVFLGAKITFTKSEIAYVKVWSEDENDALRMRWLGDKEEKRKAELKRQKFEFEQMEKGLVKYKGKWIEESKKDKLKTKEYIDDILSAKAKRGEIVSSGQRKRTKIARSLLAKGRWRNRQTEHFIVYYEDTIQSKIVADKAEYYYEKIAYDLDYEKTIYWPQKCEVFIVPNEEKWQEYMEEFIQRFDHIGGFVPRSGEKEIYLCSLSLPYLAVTFPHELTHLIFQEFAKGDEIPLWLNEGLSIYESGLIGYADEMLREKVASAGHIPLKEVVELESYPKTKEEMELYYAQAQKIVEFLITQHGRRKFAHFSRLLISGQQFSEALNFVYGDKYYSHNEFNRAWIKYVLK